MGAATYIGRVGGLAVALGVGTAVATGHGVALAEPTDAGSTSASTSSDSSESATSTASSESAADSAESSAAQTGIATSTVGAHISSTTSPDSGTSSAATAASTTEDPAPTVVTELPDETATPTPTPTAEAPASGDSAPSNESPALAAPVDEPAPNRKSESTAAATVDVAPHAGSLAESTDTVHVRVAEAEDVGSESVTTPSSILSAVAVPMTSAAAVPMAAAPVTPASFVTSVVTGVLSLFGWNPQTSANPAAPVSPPPLVELIWAAFRRIETLFFNHAPTAHPVQIGQSTTGIVTGDLNVGDTDGDPLTYTVIQGPTKGFVEINPDGTYEYTPLAPLTVTGGTDTFVVKISDTGFHFHGLLSFLQPDWGHSTQTTVTVSVTPTRTNAPPVAGDPAYTLGQANPRTGAVTVTFHVTDADGDSLGYQETSAPAKGDLPVDGIHGTTWTYVPTQAARINAGAPNATLADKQDTFTISISDGIATPITVTVTVPVTAPPAVNTVIATIPVGQGVGPTDMVFSPDGKRLYVLNGTSGGVSIIDTVTNTNIGVVPPLPTGPSPTSMAISADGTRLYITCGGYNGGPDQVVVVDTAKLYYPETVANISVGDDLSDVVLSLDGKYLYVANRGDNSISVITLV